MASVRKKARGGKVRYDATVTRKGAPRLYKTFDTRAAAETWAREQERGIERGEYRNTDRAKVLTLGEALDTYEEKGIDGLKSQDWVKSMARTIKFDEIARYPLNALGTAEIEGYRDRRLAAQIRTARTKGTGDDLSVSLVKGKRKVSGESVRKEIALIGRAIKFTQRKLGVHLAQGNPVALVERPKPGKARDRRLTPDEEKRLFAAAAEDKKDKGGAHARTKWLVPVLTFALETGARRGEIVSLLWEDVDFKHQEATLRDTKNGEDRTIPLSTRALAAIQKVRDNNQNVGPVFDLTANAVRQQWKRLVKRAEIEDLNFHDLRHEAVSRLFEKGLNPFEVATVSGHKDMQTLKRYTHLKARDIAKKLG